MDIKFTGKRVLVTGAGRGIGRECVSRLVASGAHVLAVSKTEENLISLQKEVRKGTYDLRQKLTRTSVSGC